MINLGVVVVYVVPTAYEGLLDLHLRQVARHTHVPYSIFGCSVRSSRAAVDRLRANPHVRLMTCAPTTARGAEEHAYYLDELTRCAIDSGSTHVAILHVDSFPIHDGWVEHMRAKLSPRCALVTGTGGDPSCMMFTREFYLHGRPRFLPSAEERERAKFVRCVNDWDLFEHSGVGYAFQAYMEGLNVHFMTRVTPPNSIATIYDQRVFHLGGGFKSLRPLEGSQVYRSVRGALFDTAATLARAVVPAWVRVRLRRRLGGIALAPFDEGRGEATRLRVRKEMESALANPEAYLTALLNHPR